MDSRRVRPPPAVAWRGAREARDGDGGRGGRADAGRALREAGPEAAQARSERDERTPRNGPRGRVRRGVRPPRPHGSRRSRTRGAPGRPLRAGTASAKTGSEKAESKARAEGEGRPRRLAVPQGRSEATEGSRSGKCGEKSEAEPGRGWDREREEAKAASTPPSRRAPRERRVRVSPSAPAFRNAATWKPGACERTRPHFTCVSTQMACLRASATLRRRKVGNVQRRFVGLRPTAGGIRVSRNPAPERLRSALLCLLFLL